MFRRPMKSLSLHMMFDLDFQIVVSVASVRDSSLGSVRGDVAKRVTRHLSSSGEVKSMLLWLLWMGRTRFLLLLNCWETPRGS